MKDHRPHPVQLVISRLDKLSRNEEVKAKLEVPDAHWDLVVCDEAHKMSASFFRRRFFMRIARPAAVIFVFRAE